MQCVRLRRMANAVKQRDFMRAHGESKEATLNPTRCTRSNCMVWFLNKTATATIVTSSKLLAQQNGTENVLLYSDLLDAMHCQLVLRHDIRLRIRSKVCTRSEVWREEVDKAEMARCRTTSTWAM